MQKNAHPRAVGSLLLFLFSLLVLLADAGTKFLFFDRALLQPGAATNGHVFIRLAVHANFGGTFNAPIPIPLLILSSLSFLAWIVLMFFRIPRWWERKTALLGAGLLIGGALGNLIDRFRLGFVRDWILVGNTSILNLADIAIVIGCIGLLHLLVFPKPGQDAKAVPRGGA